jgi:hypothetical protein
MDLVVDLSKKWLTGDSRYEALLLWPILALHWHVGLMEFSKEF